MPYFSGLCDHGDLQEVPMKHSYLTDKHLVFWKSGCWGEVPAYDKWLQPEVWLYMYVKYKHCLKLQCTCTQLISTRCCLQLYMHLLYLETEGTWVYLLWGSTCISNTKLQIVTEKCFQTTCTTKEVQCCRKWLREGPFFSFFALKKG